MQRTVTKSSERLAAVGIAVGLHVIAFVAYIGIESFGALGQGADGVEVGLGMLQQYGDSEESDEELDIEDEEEPPEEPPEAPRLPEIPPEQDLPVLPTRDEIQDLALDDMLEPALDQPDLASILEYESLRSRESATFSTRGFEHSATGQSSSFGRGGVVGAKVRYNDRVRSRLNRFKRYPPESQRTKQEGNGMLYLHIRNDGTLVDFYLVSSTGHALLDQAIEDMVDRAQPFPRFPDRIQELSTKLYIPVEFSLLDVN